MALAKSGAFTKSGDATFDFEAATAAAPQERTG